MRVLPMEARHLDAVAELEKACFSTPWSREALEEELHNPNAVYLVAEEDGAVLGYGGMRFAAGEFYIDNIAVFSSCRRRGVGAAVAGALVEQAERMEGDFISLEVRASNAPAVSLYERLGFQPAGRRKGFYTKPAEDALIMTRLLEHGKEKNV